MKYVTDSEIRWEMDPLIPDLSVQGPKTVDTGLMDKYENKIFRIQDEIGFHRIG